MDNTAITVSNGATSFTGDAVGLFRARTIASAMGLYLKTGMKANRAYTPTNMLAAAAQITGKTYKRGKAGLEQAKADLENHCNVLASAIPVIDERK